MRTVVHPSEGSARDLRPRVLAVALHDVEPATYERCVRIRDWLTDRGLDRATLLVIPAMTQAQPELARWLLDRVAQGDTVAQHGFDHRQLRRASPLRQLVAHRQAGDAAEFCGLTADETRRRVQAGRRVLRLAGLEPRGFVAPGYAYTGALLAELTAGFEWWGRLHEVGRRGRPLRSPALTLGTSTAIKRATSPALVRGGARLARDVLRLDLHPADFGLPGHVRTLDAVLSRAGGRRAVTYDELCSPN